MKIPLFSVTLAWELLLFGSFLWSVLSPRQRIWPPPGRTSWQFWCVWILTTGSLVGFFVVSLLDWNSFVFAHWSRYLIGGAIFLGGTLFALWGVATLGLRTSAGLEGELVRTGPYRWSRNPQYFGDFGVLLGWAIISNSLLTFILAGVGIVCFYSAVLCEEPWLQEKYGERYEAYRKRAPRFLGRPQRRKHTAVGEGSLDYEPGVLRVFESKDEAKAYYDRIAGVYDLLTDKAEQPMRAAGLEKLAVGPGERVLEIGYGTGHSLLELAKSVGDGGRVFGIDLSEAMRSVARKRLQDEGLCERVDLQCGDAEHLPYDTASFDAVFTSFTLELFDTPVIPKVLAECRRVLRPGGRIVVVSTSKEGRSKAFVTVYEWMHRRFPHLVDCRPIYVRRALEAADFSVKDTELRHMWVPVEIVLGVKNGQEGSERSVS